ncbi:MAG: hypothetical protein LBV30_07650 [Propionibacteriaceae bacterium]|jgi:hypothetical protein|nr:hypothetical protein [Propionibacteriaceae bacterium]
MSSPNSVLPALDPAVRAKRRRQNRVAIAVMVLVLVPLISQTFFPWASTQVINSWMAQQTIAANRPTTIHISSPGRYQVWVVNSDLDCRVSFDGADISQPGESDYATEINGIESAASFQAQAGGDYLVECLGTTVGGYAFVSTDSPMMQAVFLSLAGRAGIVVGVIVGVILLIRAFRRNGQEKSRPLPMVATQVPTMPVAAPAAPWSTQPWNIAPQSQPSATGPAPIPPASGQVPPPMPQKYSNAPAWGANPNGPQLPSPTAWSAHH